MTILNHFIQNCNYIYDFPPQNVEKEVFKVVFIKDIQFTTTSGKLIGTAEKPRKVIYPFNIKNV